MKKHLSLLVAILALLTFSSQKALAAAPTQSDIDNYKQMPLTFEITTSTANIALEGVGYSKGNTVKLEYRYSTDGGAWTEWTAVPAYNSGFSMPSAVTLGGGSSPYKPWKMQFRGTNPSGLNTSSSKYVRFAPIASSATIKVYGNIMSLIVGYDTDNEEAAKLILAGADEIPNNYCFYGLFEKQTGNINNMGLLDATNLIFPATKLKDYCYSRLFYNNVNGSKRGLQQGPVFLATDFVDANGDPVEHAFEYLCYNCSTITQICVRLQNCYSSDESNLTNWLYNCSTYKTLYAPSTFTACGSNNTGMSDAVWNTWTKSNFQYTTTTHHVIFRDADNNVAYEYDATEGSMPSYRGSSLMRDGFTLQWSPALSAVTEDQTYVATYIKDPDYFTITNTGSTTATVQLKRQGGTYSTNNVKLSYSVNGGEWTDEVVYGTAQTDGLSISLPAGQTIRYRGYNVISNTYMFGKSNSSMIYWYFYFSTSNFKISGDIMSLVAYHNNDIETDVYPLSSYCFEQLFKSCSNITDVASLKLPAQRLGSYCYDKMFTGCGGITTPPALPATTMASHCYDYMFSSCTGLTSAPALPATTLAPYCFYGMFNGCTHITTAPNLPVTDLEEGCYGYMFKGCSALSSVQAVLPGTTLPRNCYQYMFYGCSSLTTGPEIMAEASAIPGIECCNNMFFGCTSMTKGPSILRPTTATSNSNSCYNYMFGNCTNLENAPEIGLTTITGSNVLCYMFYNCAKINKICVHFQSWPLSCTLSWVYGVSPTGTFYCPSQLERKWESSYNGYYTPRDYSNRWDVCSYDITLVPVGAEWADGTSGNKHFTWGTDVTDIQNFLAEQVDNNEVSIILGYYLGYNNSLAPENLTNETTKEDLLADLYNQQSTETKTIYVSLRSSSTEYTITFKSEGITLGEGTVAAGVTPAFTGSDPSKGTDSEYSYTFAGWSPTPYPADKDQIYTAVFNSTKVKYNLTWVTDGDALTGTYTTGMTDWGVAITVPNTPTKSGYVFAGWDINNDGVADEVTTMPKANTQYTALWNAVQYTITFKNGDATLQSGKVNAGDVPTYGGELPSRPSTIEKDYVFTGWSPTPYAADKDQIYMAQFSETDHPYTIHITAPENGTLVVKDNNGQTIADGATVPYNTILSAVATPDAGYKVGEWTSGGESVLVDGTQDEITFSVTFTALQVYTVTLDWTYDGVIRVTGGGKSFSSSQEEEQKESMDFYEGTELTCTLIPDEIETGWGFWTDEDYQLESSVQTIKRTVTGDMTLFAMFGLKHLVLDGHEDASFYEKYYYQWVHELEYKRTFGAKDWQAMWMPFPIDIEYQGLEGILFSLSKSVIEEQASGIIDVALSFHRLDNGILDAGDLCLFYSKQSVVDFVFKDIVFPAADKMRPNNTSVGTGNSKVNFIGQTTYSTIGGVGDEALQKSYRYLKGNVLHYPKLNSGVKMQSYNGYWQIDNYNYWYAGGASSAPRLRIIVDGEEITEADMDEDEVELKKYINEEGKLVIERNGVRYGANGERLSED